MIILVHDSKRVISVTATNGNKIPFSKEAIGAKLFELSIQFPDETIGWCHEKYANFFNVDVVVDLLHHDKMILSYNPESIPFLGNGLGYVDHASILKINKEVTFFTWQMSGNIGVAKAVLLNALNSQVPNKKENFEYLLHSIAKRASINGLFCYSEPKLLLTNSVDVTKEKVSEIVLFRFVKQHTTTKWLFFLFLNILIYERRIAFLPLLFSLFYSTRKFNSKDLDSLSVCSKKQVVFSNEIDVIIPTIGRKKYLYDVLKHLSKQTHLPKNVIIVEQNPFKNSVSELDYLQNEVWPFNIKHTFTHQAGVCNARNLSLDQVESEWIFMCDDDNQFETTLIENVLINAKKYGVNALITAYPQLNEFIDYNKIHQTIIFGSGNSFVKRCFIEQVEFDLAYEFCYGEDFDFGMQLQNIGVDVVYFPKPHIIHLKAPIGGFRMKPILKWDKEKIQPIPSPTILLNYLKYRTEEQLNAYKTILFFKAWYANKWDNPYTFVKNKMINWNRSYIWANQLLINNINNEK